jgi:hypothetical protein
MARAIALRGDFDAATMRQLARKSKNGPPARRGAQVSFNKNQH